MPIKWQLPRLWLSIFLCTQSLKNIIDSIFRCDYTRLVVFPLYGQNLFMVYQFFQFFHIRALSLYRLITYLFAKKKAPKKFLIHAYALCYERPSEDHA